MPQLEDVQGPRVLSGADLVVKADPDKMFFIDMLVKDIELLPAVLDLVDNSVDSARDLVLRRLEQGASPDGAASAGEPASPQDDDAGEPSDALPEGAYEGLYVHVVASGNGFSITDNCAGMSVSTARNYAFRFGRPKAYKGVSGSVGEFGVGMKRALFKLGTAFSVTSRTDETQFDLNVVVEDWAQEPGTDWTFRMDSATEGLPPDPGSRGTVVSVEPLHDTVAADLDDNVVLGQLREQMRIRHQGALSRGLSITLNGEKLRGLLPALLSGEMFRPTSRAFDVSRPEGDVFVRMYAGVVRSDRRNVDEGQAEEFRNPGEAGWWVFCNERLLLAADRSAETGWGNPAALYHPQYRTFRGYVYLQSINPALLPWNTTKTDVDQDSPVWRQVQAQMKRTLVEVQVVMNKIKSEREAVNQGEDDDDPPPTPVLDAMEEAAPTPLRSLTRAETPVLPTPPAPSRKPPRPKGSFTKVQFNVDNSRYEQVADSLDAKNTGQVGRGVFDYYYRREIDDQ